MCILITYIVNKFNNIYHRAIKMKPVAVKRSINIKFSKKNNNNNKAGPNSDNVIIVISKNIKM